LAVDNVSIDVDMCIAMPSWNVSCDGNLYIHSGEATNTLFAGPVKRRESPIIDDKEEAAQRSLANTLSYLEKDRFAA